MAVAFPGYHNVTIWYHNIPSIASKLCPTHDIIMNETTEGFGQLIYFAYLIHAELNDNDRKAWVIKSKKKRFCTLIYQYEMQNLTNVDTVEPVKRVFQQSKRLYEFVWNEIDLEILVILFFSPIMYSLSSAIVSQVRVYVSLVLSIYLFSKLKRLFTFSALK